VNAFDKKTAGNDIAAMTKAASQRKAPCVTAVTATVRDYCAAGKRPKAGVLSKLPLGNALPGFQEIHPAGLVELPPPLTIEPEPHRNFPDHSRVHIPPTYVARLRNAWVMKNDGAVIAAEGTLLADVSRVFLGWNGATEHYDDCASPKHLNGITGLIATAGKGYYHFLWDSVPRLGLLKLGGFEPADLDHLIVKKVNFNCRDEILELLGIDPARLIASHGSSCFEVSELILPSLVNAEGTRKQPGAPYVPAKWVCDFLRASFPPSGKGPEPGAGLYISRRGAAKRRVENEPEVEAFLASRGIRAVSLETLSFQQQVDLFAAARIVVAPHGAGLSNLAFCKPGTRVIEIFPPNEAPPCYWAISAQCGLTYHYFMGETCVAEDSFRTSLEKLERSVQD
jgi:hypothetical protein